MQILFQLFSAFFQIGLFLFGGGYSMLPHLQREIVSRRKWASSEEILDYFAIGQCTPGVIAVNVAVLIGYKHGKFLGALFATVGVVTPSLIIISVIAAFLSNFMDIPAVIHAFAGIRVATAALIVSAVWKLVKSNVLIAQSEGESARHFRLRIGFSISLALISFTLVALFGASPVYIVIGAALFGIFFYAGRGAKG